MSGYGFKEAIDAIGDKVPEKIDAAVGMWTNFFKEVAESAKDKLGGLAAGAKNLAHRAQDIVAPREPKNDMIKAVNVRKGEEQAIDMGRGKHVEVSGPGVDQKIQDLGKALCKNGCEHKCDDPGHQVGSQPVGISAALARQQQALQVG